MITLEEIAAQYGMNIDYLDHNTNYIYALSEAMENADDKNKLKIPVYEIKSKAYEEKFSLSISSRNRGKTAYVMNLIGHAMMEKPKGWRNLNGV